ncbi:hypothetical protein P7K49_012091 [Saguinus oedipus]|uniref:Uncharacterized protein n=1 Tax=Saguinus oedipus TaxID=9490 RepID=A0ABQ9VU25_SAGOE|nr:hypothetical protein P7K49_012091 [Saguinus oedipus]
MPSLRALKEKQVRSHSIAGLPLPPGLLGQHFGSPALPHTSFKQDAVQGCLTQPSASGDTASNRNEQAPADGDTTQAGCSQPSGEEA